MKRDIHTLDDLPEIIAEIDRRLAAAKDESRSWRERGESFQMAGHLCASVTRILLGERLAA